ncbi:MAG: TraR/DksA C4-type zinc finger protein [Dermatophilaceae bacterium]
MTSSTAATSATKRSSRTPAAAPARSAQTTGTRARTRGSDPSTSGAGLLPVRPDEDPWTADEIAEIRREIERDIQRAVTDIQVVEEDLQGLIWDAGDGSGDDQADAGAKTYEREQEISLANVSRDKLAQNRHALERLNGGTYGVCEACSQPIGKFRLQAAPRATLCRSCKEKAERG